MSYKSDLKLYLQQEDDITRYHLFRCFEPETQHQIIQELRNRGMRIPPSILQFLGYNTTVQTPIYEDEEEEEEVYIPQRTRQPSGPNPLLDEDEDETVGKKIGTGVKKFGKELGSYMGGLAAGMVAGVAYGLWKSGKK